MLLLVPVVGTLLVGAGAEPPLAATVGRFAEPKQYGSFAPAPAPQISLETVTVDAFQSKVLDAVNQSGLAAYVAIAYFHLPSCKPCQETLPALQSAIERIDESTKSRFVVLIRPIRIFVLDCSDTEAKDPCQRFAEDGFPAIVGFRQGRVVPFNRPREPEVLAWWMARVARPSFYLIEGVEHWQNLRTTKAPGFLLLLSDATHQESVSLWEELSVDNLERVNFYLAVHSQGIWDFLPGKPPSVHVYAHEELGLDPMPFKWVPQKILMQNWIDINALPPVTTLSSWNCRHLLGSDLSVIVLRHSHDETSVNNVADFQTRVEKDLRQRGRYLFATLDVELPDARAIASSWFPLMNKNLEDFFPFDWNPPPEIFVFTRSHQTGDPVFWYQPDFPSAAKFTLKDIDDLTSESRWFHDNSLTSLALQYLLRFDRFGARSPLHRLIWLITPFGLVCWASYTWRGLCFFFGCGAARQKKEVATSSEALDNSVKWRKSRKGSKKTR